MVSAWRDERSSPHHRHLRPSHRRRCKQDGKVPGLENLLPRSPSHMGQQEPHHRVVRRQLPPALTHKCARCKPGDRECSCPSRMLEPRGSRQCASCSKHTTILSLSLSFSLSLFLSLSLSLSLSLLSAAWHFDHMLTVDLLSFSDPSL
jgi:hypothetical protein